MQGLSPLRKLNQGYSYVTDSQGTGGYQHQSGIREGEFLEAVSYQTVSQMAEGCRQQVRRYWNIGRGHGCRIRNNRKNSLWRRLFRNSTALAHRLEDQDTSHWRNPFALYKEGMELAESICSEQTGHSREKRCSRSMRMGHCSEFSRANYRKSEQKKQKTMIRQISAEGGRICQLHLAEAMNYSMCARRQEAETGTSS